MPKKGPLHDPSKCNEVNRSRNLMKLLTDDEGAPTKTPEKISSKVIKGTNPSPTGTIRLAQQGTVGAAKPPESKVKVLAKDLFKFQCTENWTDTTPKKLQHS